MDKLVEITKLIQDKLTKDQPVFPSACTKTTNPIEKQLRQKMVQFTNADLSKKFNINDLLR